MKPPRHKWVQQEGFRIEKCEHCGTTRYWDEGYQRMMFRKENSGVALYWAPSCKFVMITDKPIKM
jgi:hypothetical protein